MGVSKNRGTPKWMVKIMENPIKMDDLGVPLFSETPTWTVKCWLVQVPRSFFHGKITTCCFRNWILRTNFLARKIAEKSPVPKSWIKMSRFQESFGTLALIMALDKGLPASKQTGSPRDTRVFFFSGLIKILLRDNQVANKKTFKKP